MPSLDHRRGANTPAGDLVLTVSGSLITRWSRPGNLCAPALSSISVQYLFFVGLGEELLNRGYVQSRLDQAFGKPFAFGGARFGWGVVIASLLFGLSHVTNGLDPVAGTFEPQWWWGLWTFFSGLVFGYVREKTGSIIAPAVLHGLPQALVYFWLRGI